MPNYQNYINIEDRLPEMGTEIIVLYYRVVPLTDTVNRITHEEGKNRAYYDEPGMLTDHGWVNFHTKEVIDGTVVAWREPGIIPMSGDLESSGICGGTEY